MQHYSKYKTTSEGANLFMTTDLNQLDEHILRFKLNPNLEGE